MHIELKVDWGDHIDEVEKEAKHLAAALKVVIKFTHNFTHMTVFPDGSLIR